MSLADLCLFLIGLLSLISSVSYIVLNSDQLIDLYNKGSTESYIILSINLINQCLLLLISLFLIHLACNFSYLLNRYLCFLCLISILARLAQLNVIFYTDWYDTVSKLELKEADEFSSLSGLSSSVLICFYSSNCLKHFSFDEPVATQPVAVQAAAAEKEEEEEEEEEEGDDEQEKNKSDSLRRDSSRKARHFGVCTCMRKHSCPHQAYYPHFSSPCLFNHHTHHMPWYCHYPHGPPFNWPHYGPYCSPQCCRHYT